MLTEDEFSAAVGLIDVYSMKRALVLCVSSSEFVPVGWPATHLMPEDVNTRCPRTIYC